MKRTHHHDDNAGFEAYVEDTLGFSSVEEFADVSAQALSESSNGYDYQVIDRDRVSLQGIEFEMFTQEVSQDNSMPYRCEYYIREIQEDTYLTIYVDYCRTARSPWRMRDGLCKSVSGLCRSMNRWHKGWGEEVTVYLGIVTAGLAAGRRPVRAAHSCQGALPLAAG